MNDARTFSASPMNLTTSNFRFVAEMLAREAAIVLETGKEYLVETRLAPFAARHGRPHVNAFIDDLRSDGSRLAQLSGAIVDALTTNETLFFRDVHPFEALRTRIIPQLREARAHTRTLSIWSAACSTGQEPYSLAMLLAEHFPELADWNIRILATDISCTALGKAASGVFTQLDVNRGLPAPYLVKYFRQEGSAWVVGDEIRRRVEFRRFNLARPWLTIPRFDLVLLRNVMIYFDLATRRTVLGQLGDHLAPDGHLLLGTAENAMSLDARFAPVSVDRTTFYTLAG